MFRNSPKKGLLLSIIVLGASHLTYAQSSDFESSESRCDVRGICIGDRVDTKEFEGGTVTEHDDLGRVVITYFDQAKKAKAFAAVFSEDIISKNHPSDYKDWYADSNYRVVHGPVAAYSNGVFAKDYEACGMNLPKGTPIRPDNSAYQSLLESADQYCIVNQLRHCRVSIQLKHPYEVKEGLVFKKNKGFKCSIMAEVYGLEAKPASSARINDSTGQTEDTASSEPQGTAGAAY